MTEKENIPAYEALESNIDHLEKSAERCVQSLNTCVDSYVSGRDYDSSQEELPCQVENVAIIHRLNTRIDSITAKLRTIEFLSEMLEQDLPNRITGKSIVVSDDCTTSDTPGNCFHG